MAAIPSHTPFRRRHARYELTCPLEVTVLRSGIPQNLPGRIVDAGLGGISIVVSADLFPGESIGIEFQLADAPAMIQARARVRYHDRLRCGLEFSTVAPDKLEFVRLWTDQRHRVMRSQADTIKLVPLAEPSFLQVAQPRVLPPKPPAPRRGTRRIAQVLALLAAAVALSFTPWAYQHFVAAPRLLAHAPPPEALHQRVIVPPDVMQSLITHRTMPDYPELAQEQGVEGSVLLDTVIGKDGRVLDLRLISGPAPLAPAATDAVKNWRFSPFTLNGDAVEVETTIEVEFRLKDR